MVASCFGGGAFFARVQDTNYSRRYQETLHSGELFYLVDEAGKPVSQEAQ